ncbi:MULTISPECIES: hypothetical protein [unclassified Caballeronia]|uniref:hypothetical protein n=1 Tax=unclassified Caballeronia TaxID=2646786 RepID=UPI002865D33C|nr:MULTISPECIES: hypothetical protein [unclassified Caballeronia]MDR5749567.1 hypothetical protein [Caballeronia sp. LZ024]MDR5843303.1 hypothetical protein [Caballeronia sp. LZ031]
MTDAWRLLVRRRATVAGVAAIARDTDNTFVSDSKKRTAVRDNRTPASPCESSA